MSFTYTVTVHNIYNKNIDGQPRSTLVGDFYKMIGRFESWLSAMHIVVCKAQGNY